MKTIKFYLGLLLMASFFAVSCNNDNDDVFIPEELFTPPNSGVFKNHKVNSRNDLTQTFNFSINSGTTEISFISEKGVEVRIQTGCMTIGGVPVSGDVSVEFIELYNRGNLLTTGINTMGRHPNGDLETLVTGGAFMIEAYKDGVALDQSTCFTMKVPTSNTGGVDYDMILWKGEFNEDDNLVWDDINEGTGGQAGIEITNENYYAFLSQFGWTNIDRWYSDPRPKTTLYVSAPEGYNPGNSMVLLTYDGEDHSIARLDKYDEDLKLFSEHYGMIPIGLECHLIFVSEHEGDWVYAVKSITIAADETYSFNHSELDITSESNLTNIINGLP